VLELHPMAHRAEPLMKNGGTLFTMTYYGSQMAVKNLQHHGSCARDCRPPGQLCFAKRPDFLRAGIGRCPICLYAEA
jgi:hypothetical protein